MQLRGISKRFEISTVKTSRQELVDAGMETGQAYGKALRTVKSCVGTSWCRYGQQDSVTMAVTMENRYKGRAVSPHDTIHSVEINLPTKTDPLLALGRSRRQDCRCVGSGMRLLLDGDVWYFLSARRLQAFVPLTRSRWLPLAACESAQRRRARTWGSSPPRSGDFRQPLKVKLAWFTSDDHINFKCRELT